MTEPDSIQTLKITGLSHELKGSGFSGTKEYSFRYVNPGDTVLFEVRGRGKRRYSRIEEIRRGGDFSHKCNVYGKCGGCAGQHIDYAEQFRLKTEKLAEIFAGKFGLQLKLKPAVKSYSYRNRMDFTVHPGLTGLHQAENFRRIIDVEYCDIQSDEANQELAIFRSWLGQYPELPYNRKTEDGFLKYITIRKGSNLVSILTFIDDFMDAETEQTIAASFARVSGADNIIFCYNRKKSEVSADGKFKVIRGDEYFRQEISGKKVEVPFNSFFQPNPDEFLNILTFLRSYIEKIPGLENYSLLDLFCGSGFFSLLLGDLFPSVTGFDSVPSSIESARVSYNRLYPEKEYDFRAIDLFSEKAFSENLGSLSRSVTIVDPPRAGLGEKLAKFINLYGGEYLFYVSCNPWNQISDLEILQENYQLIEGLICDPYPQTPHLESVVFLRRKR